MLRHRVFIGLTKVGLFHGIGWNGGKHFSCHMDHNTVHYYSPWVSGQMWQPGSGHGFTPHQRIVCIIKLHRYGTSTILQRVVFNIGTI